MYIPPSERCNLRAATEPLQSGVLISVNAYTLVHYYTSNHENRNARRLKGVCRPLSMQNLSPDGIDALGAVEFPNTAEWPPPVRGMNGMQLKPNVEQATSAIQDDFKLPLLFRVQVSDCKILSFPG